MPQRFQVTLTERIATADVISILRHSVRQPVRELKEKILAGLPIIDEKPHHNAYDEFIDTITAFLRDLDTRNVGYSITIDGRLESEDYLRNIFARWHQTGRDLQEYDDKNAQTEEGC